MEKVPFQEATDLLHIICISEEIKCESSVQKIFTFSVKQIINSDPVRLEMLALGASIARQCITPLSHRFRSHMGLY